MSRGIGSVAVAVLLAGCAGGLAPTVVDSPAGCRVAAVVGEPAPAGLRDQVVGAHVHRVDGSTVYAYRPRRNLGISIQDAAGGWTHLGPLNAPMRSGRVERLVADATGGIWLVYADSAAGVSRVSGTVLETFGPENSALPVADVEAVFAEPSGEGPPGDAVWCVTADGLTRWLPDAGWTHFGRAHAQATEALRVLGLDEWLTRKVIGIRDMAFGGGQAWVATARTVYRFDGTAFSPLPDDHVGGLAELRYDRLVWAGGCLWATLRHRDSRRIEGAVRWTPGGAAWGWLPLEAAGEAPGERIRLGECGGRAWLTSPGWRGRALTAGADDAGWRRAEPGGGPGTGAIE